MSGDCQDETSVPKAGIKGAFSYLSKSPIDCLLLTSRLVTIVFIFFHLFPIFGFNSQTAFYQKALIANAVTSALRLYQRIPRGQSFSREFLTSLLLEDSCAYLMYSLIFIFNAPISMALAPILAFSALHSMSFVLKVIDHTGERGPFARSLNGFIEKNATIILQAVALSEILLMPITVVAIFAGIGSILTPILYYRFLSFRYASRRNPYSRQMFHKLRIAVELLISQPRCPNFIRTIGYKLIQLICRLDFTSPNS